MKIQNIAVVGAGVMGHGIAQVFALAGFPVTLTDKNEGVLERAIPRIQDNLQTCVEHGFVGEDEAAAVPARIKLTVDLAVTVAQADFVVEAVYEDLSVKREVLRELESHCPRYCIIASNSSSFRVGDMAGALSRPQQLLGTHFWNPPHLVPLVEVICGEQTGSDAIEKTLELLKLIGKYPALVRKDVPGFVGNRLQHALRREAIAIVAEGIASPADVDRIARFGFGLRLPITGPLETVDLGGLDLTLAIQTYLLPDLARSTEPAMLIKDKVARGELGAKAGNGFFEWPAGRQAQVIQRRDRGILQMVKWLSEGGYLDIVE